MKKRDRVSAHWYSGGQRYEGYITRVAMSEQATNRRAAEACGDGILGFYLRESRIVDRIVEQALKEALSTPIDGEMDMYAGDYVRQLEQTIREQAAALARAVAEERKKWESATAPLVCITNHWAAHTLGCTCSCEVCRAREALRAATPAKETTTCEAKKEDTKSKYIAGVDPEVHCSACGKTFLCDPMDAACRLCGAMGTIRAVQSQEMTDKNSSRHRAVDHATDESDDPYLHTTLHGVKVKVLLDDGRRPSP